MTRTAHGHMDDGDLFFLLPFIIIFIIGRPHNTAMTENAQDGPQTSTGETGFTTSTINHEASADIHQRQAPAPMHSQ